MGGGGEGSWWCPGKALAQRWWESASARMRVWASVLCRWQEASWSCAPCTQRAEGAQDSWEGQGGVDRGQAPTACPQACRSELSPFHSRLPMPRPQSAPGTTMTGPLKRKFDQLDEDSSSLCSSSSSLSSPGRRSCSCSPSSSVSLAWDSDEEGPWDHLPLPARDFCGFRSFTRESPSPGSHHTPSSFLKMKLGGP